MLAVETKVAISLGNATLDASQAADLAASLAATFTPNETAPSGVTRTVVVVLYQKLQLSMEITTTASAAELCDPLLDTLELGTSSNYMATCGGSKSGNTFTFDIKYPLNHNSSIYTTDQINTKTEEVKTNVTSADFPTDFQTTAAASGRREAEARPDHPHLLRARVRVRARIALALGRARLEAELRPGPPQPHRLTPNS